jgi:hypothetical protein
MSHFKPIKLISIFLSFYDQNACTCTPTHNASVCFRYSPPCAHLLVRFIPFNETSATAATHPVFIIPLSAVSSATIQHLPATPASSPPADGCGAPSSSCHSIHPPTPAAPNPDPLTPRPITFTRLQTPQQRTLTRGRIRHPLLSGPRAPPPPGFITYADSGYQ